VNALENHAEHDGLAASISCQAVLLPVAAGQRELGRRITDRSERGATVEDAALLSTAGAGASRHAPDKPAATMPATTPSLRPPSIDPEDSMR
jgi:hypothetical protein